MDVKIEFICPNCGKGHGINRVFTHITSTVPVIDFSDCDGNIYLNCRDDREDIFETDDSELFFECSMCGYILQDEDGDNLSDEDQLYSYLKSHGFLVKE